MKKLVLLTILVIFSTADATIVPLHHDNLDGFVLSEHINWTNAASNFKTSGTFHLTSTKTPNGPTDTGTTGQIGWDSSYIYVCVGTNTWKRATLSTWTALEYLLLETGDHILLETGDKIKLESSL